MRKITTALQAAVVTMLVAKRPALDRLPISWDLESDGTITVRLWHDADEEAVAPQVAAELSRAMRGARTDSYVLPKSDGTITRVTAVSAQSSGVPVSFHGYQRGLQPEGGEAE
ncbi:hypothetical protein [Streptomyces murinus]|uniref:hypothetical protein n=1 Tax=Streptomyces murinus TaxID=33900 RepID=UPI002E12DE75|nr:hypothetical protein OG516_19560 [Streptomyces murinus]